MKFPIKFRDWVKRNDFCEFTSCFTIHRTSCSFSRQEKANGPCKNRSCCFSFVSTNIQIAWPINRNFSTVEGEIAGRTEFLTAAWSDFVTYEVNGVRSGHVTPYALAKNYLEISVTNLFRQKLGIDHVDMQKPEWKNKVFFMRYQEINLDADFYDLLTCPRSGSGDYETVSLTVESKLAQVGGTSFLVNQDLLVGDKKVGLQRMQICCVSTVERKSSKLPDSFVFNPDIQPYTKTPRPRFPTSFVSEDSSPVGAVRR